MWRSFLKDLKYRETLTMKWFFDGTDYKIIQFHLFFLSLQKPLGKSSADYEIWSWSTFIYLSSMPSRSRAEIHWKQISFYLTTHIYVPVLLRTLNSIRGFVPPSALPSVGPLVEDDRVKNANTRIFVAAVMSVCVCECEWVGRECGWMFHAYVQPSATKLWPRVTC